MREVGQQVWSRVVAAAQRVVSYVQRLLEEPIPSVDALQRAQLAAERTQTIHDRHGKAAACFAVQSTYRLVLQGMSPGEQAEAQDYADDPCRLAYFIVATTGTPLLPPEPP